MKNSLKNPTRGQSGDGFPNTAVANIGLTPREMHVRLCAAAVSLLLGRIGQWSGREIARSALSLAHPAQAERDNESCFFVRAAGVHRFIRRGLTVLEWKGRVPFTFSVSLLLGGLTMPEWKGRVLTRSHCERITFRRKLKIVYDFRHKKKLRPDDIRLDFGSIIYDSIDRNPKWEFHPIPKRMEAETHPTLL
ncbi:hypothetical protein EVAR_956_1 [Eumeta japonica]|uniref:Uncharacterized protein n=1 Tax=Eumeta variegata TaxID=151549 RepID=A0A4C1SGA4_EUMVA|nr:hypothetical protein EVAR_956_1 [Eumeta japonica]